MHNIDCGEDEDNNNNKQQKKQIHEESKRDAVHKIGRLHIKTDFIRLLIDAIC